MTNITAVFLGTPFIASDLRAMLRHLTLVGQNEQGELEWMGTEEQWDRYLAETIDHE
jgi:hypothetical protein